MIYGIEKFPLLKRQMEAEIGRLRPGCSACQRRKVLTKYQKLVSEQVRRISKLK